MLCLVCVYSLPAFPNPTIKNFIFFTINNLKITTSPFVKPVKETKNPLLLKWVCYKDHCDYFFPFSFAAGAAAGAAAPAAGAAAAGAAPAAGAAVASSCFN